MREASECGDSARVFRNREWKCERLGAPQLSANALHCQFLTYASKHVAGQASAASLCDCFPQVLSNGTGMRRHPLFFIRWMWHKVRGMTGLRHTHTHSLSLSAVKCMLQWPPGIKCHDPARLAEVPPVPAYLLGPAIAFCNLSCLEPSTPQPNTDLAATLTEHPNLVLAGAGGGAGGAGSDSGAAGHLTGGKEAACMVPPPGGEIEMKRGGPGSSKGPVAEGVSRSGSGAAAAAAADAVAVGGAAGAAAGEGGRPASAGPEAAEEARAASRGSSIRGGVADDAVSLPGSIPDTNTDPPGSAGGAAAGAGVALVTATAVDAAAAAGAASSSGDASPHSAAVASPMSPVSGTASTSSGASSSLQPAVAAATTTSAPAAAAAAAAAAVTSTASSSSASGDARIIVQPGAAAAGTLGSLKLGGKDANGGGGASDAAPIVIDAKDVAAEADRVAAMSTEHLADTPIVVRGLSKVFATERGGSGAARGGSCLTACCGVTGGRAAVRSLTLAIERGECFGLLGPNGAGACARTGGGAELHCPGLRCSAPALC